MVKNGGGVRLLSFPNNIIAGYRETCSKTEITEVLQHRKSLVYEILQKVQTSILAC